MKTIIFLVLVACVFANDDLIKLMNGFMEGLSIDIKTRANIFRCATENIWNMWQEVVPKTRLAVGDNPGHMVEGMQIFLRGPLESLTFLTACDNKAFKEINELASAAYQPEYGIWGHVRSNSNELLGILKGFFESWDKYEYVEAGKKVAKITNLVFNKDD